MTPADAIHRRSDGADLIEWIRSLDRNFTRQRELIESVKGIVIGLEREQREARRGGVDIATAVVRSLVCRLKTLGRFNMTPEEMCEHLYGRKGAEFNQARQALTNLPALVQRAAANPAMTSVATWAAELVQTGNYPGLLPSLAPTSVYTQLSARALRVTLGPRATVRLAGRAASPNLAGDFIGEGEAIPVRRLALASTSLGPTRKLAVISHFSAELAERSVPTIEDVIRQGITDDTGVTLDARLLDNGASSATRPAGLLNGVTAIGATAGGGTAALAGDLGNLVAAISAPIDPVLIMSPGDRIRAVTLAPGLLTVPIISASGLTAKTVIAVDAADFASAEGDDPRFDMSGEAALHEEDTTPLSLSTPGTPNVVAAPIRSLWQTDAVAVRLVQFVVWAMRRTGRVAYTEAVTW